LERVIEEEHHVLGEIAGRISQSQDLEYIVTEVVNGYMDFLVAHPHFIMLLDREALSDNQLLRPDSLLSLSQAGVQMIEQIAKTDQQASLNFLLSLVALCWYPLSQARTFARSEAKFPSLISR
jgi:hypothetical protein